MVRSSPDDPEEWTDEEWLAWLAETDEVPPAERGGDAHRHRTETTEPSWRSAGLGGRFVAAAMVGMAEAIYGPREKPAIVIDASGDPPGDEPLDVHLDPDRPEDSIVVIRPWLLERRDDHGAPPPS